MKKENNEKDTPSSQPEQDQEQRNLEEMQHIRDARHEPNRSRLDQFEQQEKTKDAITKDSPVFTPGTLFINEREIITPQDFADAIEDAHGKYPKLYGFEVYEEEEAEKKRQREREEQAPDPER